MERATASGVALDSVSKQGRKRNRDGPYVRRSTQCCHGSLSLSQGDEPHELKRQKSGKREDTKKKTRPLSSRRMDFWQFAMPIVTFRHGSAPTGPVPTRTRERCRKGPIDCAAVASSGPPSLKAKRGWEAQRTGIKGYRKTAAGCYPVSPVTTVCHDSGCGGTPLAPMSKPPGLLFGPRPEPRIIRCI